MSKLSSNIHNYEVDNRFEYYNAEVESAIMMDDRERFVKALDIRRKWHEPMICSPNILEVVCSYNAVECAKALLSGKTGHVVDFYAPGSLFKLPPLHVAALDFSTGVIGLLLQNGFPINHRCDCENDEYNGMLPLNVTLNYICKFPAVENWSPSKDSIFNLLIRLCLPRMRQALATLKLLVSKTDKFLIQEELYHYIKEGKVVELAALLMVARERASVPLLFEILSSSSHYQSMTPRQFMTAEITLLSAMKMKLEHSKHSGLFRICKDKYTQMVSLLHLLGVLEKAGDEIAAHLKLDRCKGSEKQVAEEIALLLKQAGFSLKQEDVDLTNMNKKVAIKRRVRKCKSLLKNEIGDLSHFIGAPNDLFPFHLQNMNLLESKPLALAMPQSMEQGTFQIYEQNGNANLENRDRKLSTKKPNSFISVPYGQWRFAVNKHQPGSPGLFLRAFNTLQSLKGDTDNDFNRDGPKGDKPNPLFSAVEELCNHCHLKDWSPKLSVFKLLYVLHLPELKEQLEQIKLHVCIIDKIGDISCHYAKEGRIIELAIMLMVAREKLIPLTASKRTDVTSPDESIAINRCVMSEIQKLFDEEVGLVGTSGRAKSVQVCKAKKEKMSSVQLLLEVFERAGDIFERYLKSQRYYEIKERKTAILDVPQDVAQLLKGLGFVLKRKDAVLNDLNCFTKNLEPEQLENLSRSLLKETVVSLDLQPCKFSVMKRTPVIGMPNSHLRPSAAFSTCTFPTSFSSVRSLRTFQTSKVSSGLMLENQVSSAAVKTEPRLPIFSNRKQWASFAMTIRKGMKHI